MIAVKVKGVVLDAQQNPLLLLVDMDETMVLPIGIGFWEAQAIVLKLQGQIPPRPMTHDLIKSLCAALDATVHKIVVSDIKDSTYYAEIHMSTGRGRQLIVDTGPATQWRWPDRRLPHLYQQQSCRLYHCHKRFD